MNKFLNLITKLFIIIIISLISSSLILKRYSNNLSSSLDKYAKLESKKLVTNIIDNSLTNELSYSIKDNSLYEIKKNNNDEIELIDYDTLKINKLLTTLNNNIEKEITKKNKGFIYLIPLGALTNNIFISNLGIKIPLKISLLENTTSQIETKLEEYGLNNALLKINIKVSINILITSPYTSKEQTIDYIIPISIKIIQGLIPNYYIDNKSN